MIREPRFKDEALDGAAGPGEDPVARLQTQLNELQAYLRQKWAARTDRMLLSVRRLIVLAVVGTIGLLAMAAWVVTAVVLLLAGATGGLATLLHGRWWLAGMIVGGGAISLVALGVAVMYGAWQAASKRRTRKKYEYTQREQERQFGRSAHERATEP